MVSPVMATLGAEIETHMLGCLGVLSLPIVHFVDILSGCQLSSLSRLGHKRLMGQCTMHSLLEVVY